MRITKEQFQAMANLANVDLTMVPASKHDALIATATTILQKLHTFESIDGIHNMPGAIGLLEGGMKRLLRAAEVRIPKYQPHPCHIEAFLSLDFLSDTPATVPGQLSKDEITALLG